MRKLVVLTLLLFTVIPAMATAQSVDLIWQGDTYTPPFYEGRSLWSTQSKITFLAVPQINGVNPPSLEYRWTKDGDILGLVSGVGLNSLYFIGSPLTSPVEIGVEVLSNEGVVLAEKVVVVRPRDPELIVFENNPLYGILFNKEVAQNHTVTGPEITLSAFPLFFSTNTKNQKNISYEWSSGSGKSSFSDSVSYVIPDGSSGFVKINIGADNLDKVMQGRNKSFTLEFKNEE